MALLNQTSIRHVPDYHRRRFEEQTVVNLQRIDLSLPYLPKFVMNLYLYLHLCDGNYLSRKSADNLQFSSFSGGWSLSQYAKCAIAAPNWKSPKNHYSATLFCKIIWWHFPNSRLAKKGSSHTRIYLKVLSVHTDHYKFKCKNILLLQSTEYDNYLTL